MDEIHAACRAKVIYISGKARTGADAFLIQWCKLRGHPWAEFPADWSKRDKAGNILYGEDGRPLTDYSAGHRRNADMGDVANAVVAFWDGKSSGTGGMIDIAKRHAKTRCFRLKIVPIVIQKKPDGQVRRRVDPR